MTSLEPFVAVDALALSPDLVAVADGQVVAGSPATGVVSLGDLGSSHLGIWEMSEGTMRDVELDEVFVVLDGEAEVALLAGEDEIGWLELRPGVVVRLTAGMSTRWTVRSRLRKLYVAGG